MKYSWLLYGLDSEDPKQVTSGRWSSFENDEKAQTSTLYEEYDWSIIADKQGGKARLQWTLDNGWVEVSR